MVKRETPNRIQGSRQSDLEPAVLALHAEGLTNTAIAEEAGTNRRIVAKILSLNGRTHNAYRTPSTLRGSPTSEKHCSACDRWLPLSQFFKDKKGRGGVGSACKGCRKAKNASYYLDNKGKISERAKIYRKVNKILVRERQREWEIANPDKPRATKRQWYLINTYGITLEDFDSLLDRQDGACAICGDPAVDVGIMCVDHDHRCCPGGGSCGLCVRGILCRPCNSGIGGLQDSPQLLLSAHKYLTERGPFVGSGEVEVAA